ncbi:hypothetical protein OEA41_002009 [Lepraria neglecta]|uniref:Uncharacterized protein n=1 Tax=Lepraria neglecta TaxID=209136 RepID=A0AAD9ZE38_9LECA|nr:hypothetical protein OEA41_002009 [Lepraria neglecta]
MFKFFKSPFFNFEYLRVLGAAPFQASEISECLEAHSHLKNDDPETWYRTWTAFGDKAKALGEDAWANHDKAAARWAFLRAANYYRSSEFFLHCQPDDPRLCAAIQKSSDVHNRAVALFDTEVMVFNIPYENGLELPARLYMPETGSRSLGRIPLILQTNGFDSTGEELYLYGPAGAIPRGYAVLSFDGPGQGLSLRKDKTILRPDWEHVTSKVLDYIFDVLAPQNERLELDLNRIAVLGASMGGYFALRASADPRIKACVSCDGFYSLFEVARSRMPGWFINSWLDGTMSDGVFNAISNFLGRFNFQLKWEFAHSQWTYGVKTPADVMRVMQTMSLKGEDGSEYLEKVHCPVMVTGAAQTIYFEPDINAEKVMANLGHLEHRHKLLWVGDGESDGGIQAKIATLSLMHQYMFEWLDKQLGVRRLSASAKDEVRYSQVEL